MKCSQMEELFWEFRDLLGEYEAAKPYANVSFLSAKYALMNFCNEHEIEFDL